MEIQINSKTIPTKFDKKTGRYYATFIAENENRLTIKNTLDCIGDTQLTDIQLETGNLMTSYEPPKIKKTDISGIFLALQNLKKSTTAQIEAVNKNISTSVSEIHQNYNSISSSVQSIRSGYLAKSEIRIDDDGIVLGAGKLINGKKIASILSIEPGAMSVVTKNFKLTGDMLVDGAITAKKIQSQSIETGHIKAGSIQSGHIKSGSIEVEKLSVDDAFIKTLFAKAATVQDFYAKRAVINTIQSVKIDVNQLTASSGYITNLESVKGFIRDLESVGIKAKSIEADSLDAYIGRIGGFRLGRHSGDGYTRNWLTGTVNFNVGIADGQGRSTQAAIWAAWGSVWDVPGDNSWYVRNTGEMVCNNKSYFRKDIKIESSYEYILVGANDITWTRGSSSSNTVWWSQRDRFLSSSSDKRLKHHIQSSRVNALELIGKFNMVEFEWKRNNAYQEIGMIAQELQKILPSVIHEEDGMLSIKYIELIPYLIKGIQEITERIERIERERN